MPLYARIFTLKALKVFLKVDNLTYSENLYNLDFKKEFSFYNGILSEKSVRFKKIYLQIHIPVICPFVDRLSQRLRQCHRILRNVP